VLFNQGGFKTKTKSTDSFSLAGLTRTSHSQNVKIPECPGYLSDGAKEEWRRIVPLLDGMGIIS